MKLQLNIPSAKCASHNSDYFTDGRNKDERNEMRWDESAAEFRVYGLTLYFARLVNAL